jgi:hypothetical protein
MSKKGFDFARNSIYSVDPFDIVIIGGRGLPKEQASDDDTGDGPEHELYDLRTLEDISEEFINNIDAYGVMTPISITKIDGQAVVVAGRQRVKAARAVNLRRAARGEAALKVECKVVKPPKAAGLMGAMIAENEARRDDSLLAKIEKLKAFMARGVSLEDAARTFCIQTQTAKRWLSFDENATKEVVKAVEAGQISTSAAIQVARVKDPEEQRQALAALKGSGNASVREARRAATTTKNAGDEAKGDGVGLVSRRAQRAVLDYLVERIAKAADIGEDVTFFQGAEHVLRAILGEGKVDARINRAIKAALKDA